MPMITIALTLLPLLALTFLSETVLLLLPFLLIPADFADGESADLPEAVDCSDNHAQSQNTTV
eukprot:m.13966 g.13966  ORF g.13966 m.13966 type:complete len:63 (+) comp10259_c0_seq2:635-823(+)